MNQMINQAINDVIVQTEMKRDKYIRKFTLTKKSMKILGILSFIQIIIVLIISNIIYKEESTTSTSVDWKQFLIGVVFIEVTSWIARKYNRKKIAKELSLIGNDDKLNKILEELGMRSYKYESVSWGLYLLFILPLMCYYPFAWAMEDFGLFFVYCLFVLIRNYYNFQSIKYSVKSHKLYECVMNKKKDF